MNLVHDERRPASDHALEPSRYAAGYREMARRILEGPGRLDPAIRQAAAHRNPLEEPRAEAIATKAHDHAYKITDREIRELRESGWSEDQLFELCIAASFGAADRRLRAALGAIREAD
jgi:hypothetical protein